MWFPATSHVVFKVRPFIPLVQQIILLKKQRFETLDLIPYTMLKIRSENKVSFQTKLKKNKIYLKGNSSDVQNWFISPKIKQKAQKSKKLTYCLGHFVLNETAFSYSSSLIIYLHSVNL